jgi:RNA polymerase sigma-70 factor (ECF subfamily)
MDEAPDIADEGALRTAVLRGDAEAWRALYRRAFPSVWAFVAARTHPDAGASEEVAQETWMIAVRLVARFDPARAPFEAWVKGIAANVLRNRWRAGRRERAALPREPAALGDLAARPDLPDAAEPGGRATLALTSLPWAYQQVLRAKYEEGLPVVAIAERLGRSAKSVESMLTRAREALRRAVADGPA